MLRYISITNLVAYSPITPEEAVRREIYRVYKALYTVQFILTAVQPLALDVFCLATSYNLVHYQAIF